MASREAKVRLTLKEKQAVTGKLRKKYGQASKTEKGEIIDWLVEVAGYNRKYAATLLRNGQKKKTKQTKPKPRSGRPVSVSSSWLSGIFSSGLSSFRQAFR